MSSAVCRVPDGWPGVGGEQRWTEEISRSLSATSSRRQGVKLCCFGPIPWRPQTMTATRYTMTATNHDGHKVYHDGHKPWRPQGIPWRPQTMTATRYTMMATAMTTWKTNSVLVRNRQIHGEFTVIPSFRKHICGRHGRCLWLSWFVAIIVSKCAAFCPLYTNRQYCYFYFCMTTTPSPPLSTSQPLRQSPAHGPNLARELCQTRGLTMMAANHDGHKQWPWRPQTCFLEDGLTANLPWIWRFLKSTPLVFHVFIAVAVMV